jgi:hypothetical protein
MDGWIEPLEGRALLSSAGVPQTGNPLVITSGGTFQGTWSSTDPNTPAITIDTTDPVIIENSTIQGAGDLIATAVSGADITVLNCSGSELNPMIAGRAPGRFLDADHPANVDIENNGIEGTSGIYVHSHAGAAGTVKVIGNRAHNIDGRKADGAGGFVTYNTIVRRGRSTDGFVPAQFVQLDQVHALPGIEIAWNQVINDPGQSRVEDNINIYRSSGTPQSPLLIHDNYIQGAYNVSPAQATYKSAGVKYDWSYSGGGILLGDGKAKNAADATAYVKAYDNQVVSTTNYGMAIASGHDIEFYDNRIVSAGVLPDGTPIAQQNVGAYVWNAYKASRRTFFNDGGHDNAIGWIKSGTTRNDWYVPNASEWTNNSPLPDPITLATEASEWNLWQQKLATR